MTTNAKDTNGNYISTKYITAYSNGTGTNSGTLIYTVGKTGDATKEAYVGSGDTGWFSDHSSFAYSSYPFFRRGGYYYNSSTYAGVFYSNSSNGNSYTGYGFRTALCP